MNRGFFYAIYFYLCDNMAVREQTLRLHQAIKDDFEKLSNIKEYGVEKYTLQFKLNKLADKYFKSARTVENIVFGRTYTNDIKTTQARLDL